jgi:plasmid stabilization system protein ParE
MAANVIWSEQALDDIDAIAEYINRDSPFYAQRVAEEILELAASIAERPQIGRIVPELKDESAVALRPSLQIEQRAVIGSGDTRLDRSNDRFSESMDSRT